MRPMTITEARALALELLTKHGLTEWRVGFDTARARAGACHYGKKKISFSRILMAARDAEHTHDVILHEVAHVLAGETAGHGPVWKKIHRDLGGSGDPYWQPNTLFKPELIYRWAYTCAGCRTVLGQSIRKRNLEDRFTKCCNKGVLHHPINREITLSERVS